MITGAATITLVAGAGFQLQVYMRTDGYAILTNAFGCRNLSAVARATAQRRLGRERDGDAQVLEHAHPNDLRALRPFLAVVALGVAWSCWSTVQVAIPAFLASWTWSIDALRRHEEAAQVAQAAIVLGLIAFEGAWLAIAFWRERLARRRRAGRTRVLASANPYDIDGLDLAA